MCQISFSLTCYIECARKFNLPHIWSKYGPVLHFVLALAVVAILALLVSTTAKKFVSVMLFNCLLSKCYGVVLPELRRWFGLRERLLRKFEKLLGFANEGTNFVFGSMMIKAWHSSS